MSAMQSPGILTLNVSWHLLLYVNCSTYLFRQHLWRVTGQLVDKPTRGKSSRRLVNSRTSQLAEM